MYRSEAAGKRRALITDLEAPAFRQLQPLVSLSLSSSCCLGRLFGPRSALRFEETIIVTWLPTGVNQRRQRDSSPEAN